MTITCQSCRVSKMATGGDVGSRRTCSVCLEGFKGRTPKLLPCFHTFCVSCLAQLVDRETKLATKTSSGDDGDDGTKKDASPASLPCPTCRTVIPIPPGGVAHFQTNFYLEDRIEEQETKPQPCNLCDGVKDAKFHCSKCEKCFCHDCCRYHDKLCQGMQVKELQVSAGARPKEARNFSTSQTKEQIQAHLQMVEEALKKLDERESEVNTERVAIEQDINARYASLFPLLMRLSAEARDLSLTSLGEVSGTVTERLQSEMAQLKQTQEILQQELSTAKTVCLPHHIERQLSDLQARVKDSTTSVLQYNINNDSAVLTDSLQSFMGEVSETSQASNIGKGESMKETQLQTTRGTVSLSDGVADEMLRDVRKQLHDLTSKVSTLQSENAKLQDLTKKMSTLQSENAKLQDLTKKMSTLQSENAKLQDLTKKLSTLQSENAKFAKDLKDTKKTTSEQVSSLRDKYNIMQQDVHVLTSENDKLRKEQADIRRLKDSSADVCKNDISTLQRSLKSVQDSLRDSKNKEAELMTKLDKATRCVAFYAKLDSPVTTRTQRSLYLKHITTNIGGGYNGQTGVFTAPVSGTYCFAASTSAGRVGETARADLKLDKTNVGYLWCRDSSSCTCVVVVQVSAGQKVYLETYDEEEYRFLAGGFTTFSGILLKPQV